MMHKCRYPFLIEETNNQILLYVKYIYLEMTGLGFFNFPMWPPAMPPHLRYPEGEACPPRVFVKTMAFSDPG